VYESFNAMYERWIRGEGYESAGCLKVKCLKIEDRLYVLIHNWSYGYEGHETFEYWGENKEE